ncbi:carboxyvinyl-carboxyphosphonate phosphorylmutase [Cytophagales bacterium WSM2-2]|nr:carboxyvinyl-carboxyphosphonate phosphorylmutase [Cytophagales bacterium WSM2-2]
MSQFKKFKDLHYAGELFVLPNAWNAESASRVEQQGFPAVATSSSAVASTLGYKDGEQMPFADYFFVIQRIAATIKVPFTVDMEMGYGKTAEEIYSNISRLTDLGVAGINLEDSEFSKSKRVLQEADSFSKKLSKLKNLLVSNHLDIFINLRCDAYLINVEDKQTETTRRAKLYESSGADGLFLPCIVKGEDIRAAVSATKLPLNVMAYPGLPDFDSLSSWGVKRLSLGGFLFDAVYNSIEKLTDEVKKNKDIKSLVSK